MCELSGPEAREFCFSHVQFNQLGQETEVRNQGQRVSIQIQLKQQKVKGSINWLLTMLFAKGSTWALYIILGLLFHSQRGLPHMHYKGKWNKRFLRSWLVVYLPTSRWQTGFQVSIPHTIGSRDEVTRSQKHTLTVLQMRVVTNWSIRTGIGK